MPNIIPPGEQSALVKLTANAYIDCGPNIPVSFQAQNPWTFEGWFKFDGLCPDSTLLSKQGEFAFGTTGRSVYAKRASQIAAVTSDAVLNTDDWFHLAVTFNGTTMTLYVNGLSAGFANVYDSGVPPQPGNLQIGVGFQGEVAEFRIWNVCVPGNQLFDHMWVDYAPSSQPGLLRQYNFETVPPSETSGNNAPPTFLQGAAQITITPTVQLSDGAFCDPYDDSAVNPGGGGNDAYTILSWVNIDYLQSQNCIFSNGAWDSASGVTLYVDNGTIKAVRGGRNGVVLASSTVLQADQWYSIGYTYDGTKQTIFINGVQDAQAAAGSIPTMALGDPIIGAAFMANGSAMAMPFQGYIQSVTVWSSALPAVQIQSWMYNDPSQSDTCVANYWFGVTPIQNMVNGNSVGLVAGARFLVYQTPVPSTGLPARPEFDPYSPPVRPLHQLLLEKGVSGNPMAGVQPNNEYGIFSEEHKKILVNEFLQALPKSYSKRSRAERRTAFKARLDDVADKALNHPEQLQLRVIRTIEGSDCVLTLHYRGQQAEVYRAPVNAVDPCVVWTIQLFTTLIVGFLGVFAVQVDVDAIARFVGLTIIPAEALMGQIRLIFSLGFRAQSFIQVFSVLYAFGVFGPLIQAVVTGMSWWGLFTFTLNVVMLFVPYPTAQKAYFVFTVVDYVASVVLAWNDKPPQC